MPKAPWRHVEMGPVDITSEARPDGTVVLSSRIALAEPPPTMVQPFRRWAEQAPDRPFLAQRDGDEWATVTYGQARMRADRIAQALLDRGLGPERPVAILSGNSIDHAMLLLGAMTAGVPVVPVSVAYSLLSTDHRKLRTIIELTRPGLVYAEDADVFGAALASLPAGDAEIAASRGAATTLADLEQVEPTAAVEDAVAAQGPDAVAKILFTSGSTGEPKGVVTTQRMLATNQQQLLQVWPFLRETPPVLVDWLPWNHTFGGNNNLGVTVYNGGTLYIDAGKPTPDLFPTTIRNLSDVAPTVYYNVPAGFAMLVPELERDPQFAAHFFSRLQVIVYAAAALPDHLWDRLLAVSEKTVGERVVLQGAWGATETAPMATIAHYATERPGNIGVPVPGVRLKLVPTATKLELRVKGPNVTPGYYERPEETSLAFDDEGYYRIQDAGRLADPDDPNQGLFFDGRIAEEFKLTTGTWVHVGALRVAVLGGCPILRDAVVTAPNRDWVGLLAWLDPGAVADGVSGADIADAEALTRRPEVRDAVREQVARFNAEQRGSSMRIKRVLLLTEPADIDTGEITDKGYVNQRAVLERRAALVDRLYADPPADDVIVVPSEAGGA